MAHPSPQASDPSGVAGLWHVQGSRGHVPRRRPRRVPHTGLPPSDGHLARLRTRGRGERVMTGIDEVLAHGEVRSVLQPIVDLDSGAVVAYEALARGPQGPLERPDLLFAAARDAGRLRELDELCRRTALR